MAFLYRLGTVSVASTAAAPGVAVVEGNVDGVLHRTSNSIENSISSPMNSNSGCGDAQPLYEPADHGVEGVGVEDLRVRRIVDSLGRRPPVPSRSATDEGRTATHSATATNERAPAATAHTVTVSTTVNRCRIPRALR